MVYTQYIYCECELRSFAGLGGRVCVPGTQLPVAKCTCSNCHVPGARCQDTYTDKPGHLEDPATNKCVFCSQETESYFICSVIILHRKPCMKIRIGAFNSPILLLAMMRTGSIFFSFLFGFIVVTAPRELQSYFCGL